MKNCTFRSLTITDIPAMAELLIGRQNLESEAFPFLKNSCLDAKCITDNLESLFADSKVIGTGALVNGELVGYIMGERVINSRVGRYASVPYEGIAIRPDQSSELIRHLYAKVSVLWLEQGCFDHSILVPIGNQVYYEAVLQLSFAIEQVHAVMSVDEYRPFENAADVNVRLAEKKDSEALGRMSSIIANYHNHAPVFVPSLPEVLETRKEAFKELVEEEDGIVLIAEKDEQELGFQYYEITTPNLMTSDDAVELVVAGTHSSQMGVGIGKKLMNEGCRIAKEKGYRNIKADWRITNFASSAFWPKCGFRPVAYRMARSVDRNYAWANCNNPSIRQLQ